MDLVILRDNEEAYNRYKIKPRILTNVDNIDLSFEIFGCKASLPLDFSPTAMQKLAHANGELGVSRAAANLEIAMCLSSYATEPIEAVAKQGKGNPYAMQMRLSESRNNFILPDHMQWPNLLLTGKEELGAVTGGTKSYDYEPSPDWESAISWLRSQTRMQLWLKGVTNAEDVLLAIKYGIDGIIVSNHGGRQLDGQPATLDSLRECVAAANGKILVAIDVGIRRGSDIFKALALGACHVCVGRIPIWGLAYNGQEGVELALKILMEELKLTMGLAGCRSIRDVSRHHVTYLNAEGVLAKL